MMLILIERGLAGVIVRDDANRRNIVASQNRRYQQARSVKIYPWSWRISWQRLPVKRNLYSINILKNIPFPVQSPHQNIPSPSTVPVMVASFSIAIIRTKSASCKRGYAAGLRFLGSWLCSAAESGLPMSSAVRLRHLLICDWDSV